MGSVMEVLIAGGCSIGAIVWAVIVAHRFLTRGWH